MDRNLPVNLKKILIIGPLPPPHNGMTTATSALLNSTLTQSFRLIHLNTADKRDFINTGQFEFQNICLALKHGLMFCWMLLRHRPSMVYVPVSQNCAGYLRDCLFLLPAIITGRKLVIHLHGSHFGHFYRQSKAWLRLLIAITLKRVDRAIVLGENACNVFRGLIPDEKIMVVPNGIDSNVHTEEGARSTETIRVGYLGILSKFKGYLDVLLAAQLLIKKYPHVHFYFAGGLSNNTCWSECEEIVDKNGLRDNVHFEGVLTGDDKWYFLNSLDIFVFPSWNEGMPFVVLEAMAAGLPLVTTDVGCISEMVIDAVNGFLVAPRDVQTLAGRIERLIVEKELRVKMGAASRSRISQFFGIDRMVEKMTNVFESVL